MACYEAQHIETELQTYLQNHSMVSPHKEMSSKLPQTCYGHVGQQNKGTTKLAELLCLVPVSRSLYSSYFPCRKDLGASCLSEVLKLLP